MEHKVSEIIDILARDFLKVYEQILEYLDNIN